MISWLDGRVGKSDARAPCRGVSICNGVFFFFFKTGLSGKQGKGKRGDTIIRIHGFSSLDQITPLQLVVRQAVCRSHLPIFLFHISSFSFLVSFPGSLSGPGSVVCTRMASTKRNAFRRMNMGRTEFAVVYGMREDDWRSGRR